MKKIFVLLILTLSTASVEPLLYAATTHDLQELSEQNVKVRTVPGGIELHNNTRQTVDFQVFSITGQMLKSLNMNTGHTIVELPQGCYIVRHPYGALKVVVR